MHHFLIFDNNNESALELQKVLLEASPDSEVIIKENKEDAFTCLKENKGRFLALFMEVEQNGMLSLELHHELKEIDPELPIVYTTDSEKYALDCWRLHASGYLLKPTFVEEMKDMISHLPKQADTEAKKEITVRCFGEFEIFLNGKPLEFKRSRSKEVIAYLIDKNGREASTDEICDVLWEDSLEDKKNKNYLRQLFYDIVHVLNENHIEGLLKHRRTLFSIDVNMVDCDYYHYLKKDDGYEDLFQDEYMNQYSWAEDRLGYLMFQFK
ncbi:MAG: hypothetical protein HUJ70_00580 [Pseudobutyrivibrio sp.]|nr:hypothetical protein [Pseudobutyrivibrio sp.]